VHCAAEVVDEAADVAVELSMVVTAWLTLPGPGKLNSGGFTSWSSLQEYIDGR